ncbi:MULTISPECIES: glycoside hydrolase family 15 protein [unclassified Streptomyces]|uniref:glycoside hydrolase family 15 protein n=1 Tax=unclassified Streptomyces TaxID=2593676 RepID=UPI000691F555|nr:glycoside hydrolase family 15 protein [Streptomyces sp. NRRL F-2747]
MNADQYPAISDYAFLSDGHSLALIGRDASVEWACFHRYDAAPVFARLLDRRKGGYFRIAPTSPFETSRRYLPDTNVLETTFRTADGVVTVTDCLPVREDPVHPGRPARPWPGHVLQRHVRGVSGAVEMAVEFFPTFDFARSPAAFSLVEDAGDTSVLRAYGGAEALVLRSGLGSLEPAPVPGDADDAHDAGDGDGCPGHVSRAVLTAGSESVVTLVRTGAGDPVPGPLSLRELDDRLAETITYWRAWAARCTYRGPYRDAVVRSLLVLKGLIYAETGAIVAAPTTSLPEEIGGERNWDYRYTWLRDAAAMLAALAGSGYPDEARHFCDWLIGATSGAAKELRVLYGIAGERELDEVCLDHLDGYRGSRPVRVGNGAWEQFQLDVYGELLAALDLAMHLRGDDYRPERAVFVHDVVELAVARWREADEGIWEVRSGRRHYVFSKLMAWIGLDSAIRILDRRPDQVRGPELRRRWVREREEIRAEIERRGVDPATGAFVQAFGSVAPDATALQAILRGFVAPDDPRAAATVELIDAELTRDGHVYRYHGGDGLRGGEGSFVLCTLWLASALAYLGRMEEAEQRLGLVLGCANDLGLLAEEYDPLTRSQLGNFPQGFSHLGVIATAYVIEVAKRQGDDPGPSSVAEDYIDKLARVRRATA